MNVSESAKLGLMVQNFRNLNVIYITAFSAVYSFEYRVYKYTVPINGIDSLVSGILSAIANINTENAKITVTPRAIFSPEN